MDNMYGYDLFYSSYPPSAMAIPPDSRPVSARPSTGPLPSASDMNSDIWRRPPVGRHGYGRPESRLADYLWDLQRQKDELERTQGPAQPLSKTKEPQEQLGPFERRIARMPEAVKASRRAVQLWDPDLLTVLLPWLSLEELNSLSLVCRPLLRPAQTHLFRIDQVHRGYDLQSHELKEIEFSALYAAALFNHACRYNIVSNLGYVPLGDDPSTYRGYFYE